MSGITLDIAAIPSDKIQALHAYWQELAGPHEFPRKSQIDPSRIKKLLPYLCISEVSIEPVKIRFRLMGTRIVETWGVDWTGRQLHDGPWSAQSIAEDVERYRHMFQARRPIFGFESWTWPWRDPYQLRMPYAWSYMPLSEDGETITHCLGIDDTETLDYRAVARDARLQAELSKL